MYGGRQILLKWNLRLRRASFLKSKYVYEKESFVYLRPQQRPQPDGSSVVKRYLRR